MIVKLSYKGPKKKLKGDFEYDELVEFLKGGKGKKDLKDASGKKLTKAQKSALQSAAKVKWQWVSDDMRTQKVGMEDVLAPLNEITTEEKITVSDARGNHELSLYRGDTLGARRGYRGRYGRRRGGLGRRRRRRVGARWPGSPGRARYRHGGGMMYGYSHPYQWFPAFEGGYRGYGNAYPEMLPEVGEAAGRRRRRRRRDVGARWPGDPGRARYRHGGGVMYGYSNPYQSFPAMRGGIDYDYAYPQSLPVSGPGYDFDY